jgi:hypothetical protein
MRTGPHSRPRTPATMSSWIALSLAGPPVRSRRREQLVSAGGNESARRRPLDDAGADQAVRRRRRAVWRLGRRNHIRPPRCVDKNIVGCATGGQAVSRRAEDGDVSTCDHIHLCSAAAAALLVGVRIMVTAPARTADITVLSCAYRNLWKNLRRPERYRWAGSGQRRRARRCLIGYDAGFTGSAIGAGRESRGGADFHAKDLGDLQREGKPPRKR